MPFPRHPGSLYDKISEDREYITVDGTIIPIRTSTLDAIETYEGQTEIEIERPDGGTHTLTGDKPIPDREQLREDLAQAQREFDDMPVATLRSLHGARLGPLHYTDSTAHFTVGESIFEAEPQHGAGPIPEGFQTLGVKAAHLYEGFEIARNLSHHWVDDVGWQITRDEKTRSAMEDEDIPVDRAPPVEECLIINVPSVFPAQSFGRATGTVAEIVNRAIARTERALDTTLLTNRMAQLESIERHYTMHESGVEEEDELFPIEKDLGKVAEETFHISKSGVLSLRSQKQTRKEEAFETVKLLSESEDFNLAVSKGADTIDELGELAKYGWLYRDEVLDEPYEFD